MCSKGKQLCTYVPHIRQKKEVLYEIFLTVLVMFSLLLTSCANLGEEETTVNEKRSKREYSEYVAYAGGFSIFLDKETVRMKPLLSYGKYSELDDIVFYLDLPYEDYYIDYDSLDESEVVVSGGGVAYSTQPNGNFLTDGYTRIKLCTNKECREDETMVCTHVNLVGGYVWDNYVYYIGRYKAEKQKIGQWNAEYENYLMRYSVTENEFQLIARLPWACYITQAAYGCIYIAYLDSTEYSMTGYKTRAAFIYDCENVRLAEVGEFDGLLLSDDGCGKATAANGYFYYIYNNNIYRCDYDLGGVKLLGEVDMSDVKFGRAKYLGYAKNRVFYTVYDYITEMTSVRTLKDDGRRRTVLENCTSAALLKDGTAAELYSVENGEIAVYDLDRLGNGHDRTVVFTEGEKLAPNEHIQSIDVQKSGIYFKTEVGKDTGHIKTYILRENGAEFVRETGAPEEEEETETDDN